jgi:hypothetical protein
VTDICSTQFADGAKLVASNLLWGARTADSRQSEVLRAFADDLHRRLVRAGKPGIGSDAASAAPSVTFTAGFSPVRYRLLVGTLTVIGIGAVTVSMVAFVVTGKAQALFGLIPAAMFLWPLIKTAGKNAPRSYDPSRPPDELLQ